MKKWLLGLGILLFGMACDKEMGAQEDLSAPSIEVLKPGFREHRAGDTLRISIQIADNDQLHDVYLGLNDLDRMEKKIHWSQHFHGQLIQLDTSFYIPQERPTGHYQIQIEANDHYGNHAEKRVGVFVLGQ